MSFAQRWRSHRERIRDYRAIAQAIDEAGTPAMRNELLMLASMQFPNYNR